MKQTRMYVCTFEEFILVEILDTLLHKLELELELNIIGNTLAYIHSQQRTEKCENCS